MTISDFSRQCQFRGFIEVPISTYPGLVNEGWNFILNSLLAVKSNGYWDNVGLSWVGTNGYIFNVQNGITTYEIGDITTFARNLSWLGAEYNIDNNSICAPITASPGFSISGENVDGLITPIPQSGGVEVAAFNPALVFTMPIGANTVFPQSNSGGWWTSSNGRLLFYTHSLIGQNGEWLNNGTWDALESPSNLSWNVGQQITSLIPYQNTNWIMNGGTVLGRNLIQTSFDGNAIRYNLTYQSPDGVFDMNTVLTNLSNIAAMRTTPLGWIWLTGTVTVIAGRSFNGYGVFITPDGRNYFILRIVPTDAQSVNWRSGTPQAKMDSNGHLWFKSSTSDTQVYASLAAITTQPQVTIYPQSIPIIDTPNNRVLLK